MATPQPSDATHRMATPQPYGEKLAGASPPGRMRDRDRFQANRGPAPRIRAGGPYIYRPFTFWQDPADKDPDNPFPPRS
jgi:hypothetical protein